MTTIRRRSVVRRKLVSAASRLGGVWAKSSTTRNGAAWITCILPGTPAKVAIPSSMRSIGTPRWDAAAIAANEEVCRDTRIDDASKIWVGTWVESTKEEVIERYGL